MYFLNFNINVIQTKNINNLIKFNKKIKNIQQKNILRNKAFDNLIITFYNSQITISHKRKLIF